MTMTMIKNFKTMRTIQINAFTKKEAIEQSPFHIQKDATQAWKNNGSPIIGSPEFKKWTTEYLAANTKNAPGSGCMVTYVPGVADSRDKPYKFNDVTNKEGKRKYKTTFLLVDKATKEIVAKSQGTKADAKNVARDLYKKGYKGNLECKYTKEVIEGEPLAFEVAYTPSVSTKEGAYIVFGIDA